jgi:hypothetical protein
MNVRTIVVAIVAIVLWEYRAELLAFLSSLIGATL